MNVLGYRSSKDLGLSLFKIIPNEKTRPSWKGFLQFYAFKYLEHGIV